MAPSKRGASTDTPNPTTPWDAYSEHASVVKLLVKHQWGRAAAGSCAGEPSTRRRWHPCRERVSRRDPQSSRLFREDLDAVPVAGGHGLTRREPEPPLQCPRLAGAG